MTYEKQGGYLEATTDIVDIILKHMKPGETDDKTLGLLRTIVDEVHTNYDAKIK